MRAEDPLLYDTGALIAGENGDAVLAAMHDEAAIEGRQVIVPTPVVAQAWRDGARQVRLVRLLRGCKLEPPTERTAKEAGELLGRSRTSDAVDALVVVAAILHRADIVTSDPDDINRLIDAVTSGRRPLVITV